MLLPINDVTIRSAAERLRGGQLVAFPTETVYGLGADATNAAAVARLYKVKGRPTFNPLIVHVASPDEARSYAEIRRPLAEVVKAFWPGPLTIVVPLLDDTLIAPMVTAGLKTVALRCPDHPAAQALIRATGRPLVAPSANPSGQVSASDSRHVRFDFGPEIAVTLDGGPSRIGIESTIITEDRGRIRILRHGAITCDDLAGVVGDDAVWPDDTITNDASPSSPGQLTRHYAPTYARLRLNCADVGDADALLAFGPDVPATNVLVLNLSPTGSLVEAAAKLFDHLRAFDALRVDTVAVMPIPNDGIGRAINDRLQRAAAIT